MLFLIIWLVALFVEFLLLEPFGFMMVGVIFWTFTAVFVWCLIKGYAADRAAVLGCTIYTGIVGLLIFLSDFIQELVDTYTDIETTVSALIFGWSMGGIFLLLGFYMGVIKRLQCTMKVAGTCVAHRAHRVKYTTSYSPVFAFRVKNAGYSNSTGEIYSRRKIERKYPIGSTHTIYVNPKKPMIIRAGLGIGKGNLLMLGLGVLIIWAVTKAA